MIKKKNLFSATLLSVFCAACATGTSQHLVKGGGENSINLHDSDICVSADGTSFARKLSGASCEQGDLIYINVSFDSDEGADLAGKYCDFDHPRPAQAMDVYGYLCYSKVPLPQAKQQGTGPLPNKL